MSTEIEPNTHEERRFKRKRKSVLLKARKYQKKGHLGRGSQIDSDTYGYFVKILETYRDGFESEDDKLIFANNALEQTENEEINYSRNQLGCRVIETLLPYANNTILERFIDKFSDDLRPLCSDEFASYVVQVLVRECCKKSLITDQEDLKVEFQQKCQQFVLKVSKFLLNNLEDYIWDRFGNHIMRTCLECMAQVPTEKHQDCRIKKDSSIVIPSEYEDIVKDYGERILAWPQFSELCNEVLTSGFLQILLKSLKQTDKKLLKKYLKKLLDENFSTGQETVNYNQLLPVFLSKSLTMLLETALQVAKEKMFTQIYINCFLHRLSKLATTKATNFAVQKLIGCCEFEAIFEELEESFEQILNAGHTGILLALSQGCKKLSTKQGLFVQNLMKCLDCYEPEDRQNRFIICLLTWRKFDNFDNSIDISNEKLNLHGSLILQTILEFNKPIKIVNGLLNMDNKSLIELFCKKMGSYITQAFVNSSFVGEKNRDKLIKKLRGYYQDLASNNYGSRSFEDLWNVANLNNKLQIIAELADKDAIWSNSQCGRIIARKINLVLYKRHKDEWKNSLNVGDKAKKLFDDIVK